MTRGDAKAWLDAMIDSLICLEQLSHMRESLGVETINYLRAKEIHIYSGIEKLSEALELKLTESECDVDGYPYKYSFEYRGWEIFQLEEEDVDEWKN